MKQPTIKDISRYSGVSMATVDRVIHQRPGASAAARQKVAKAIHDLHFRELPHGLVLRGKPELRFKFILPNVYTSFAEQILGAVLEAPAAVDDARVVNDVQHVDIEEPRAIIDALDGVDEKKYAGAALFAVDAPGVRSAIDRLVSRGVKVVSLVTDVATSRRHHFVGIDNLAAGRLAGNLLGRFVGNKAGKVGIILGSTRMRDQYDRLLGFSEVLATRFPNLKTLPVVEGFSKSELNYGLTKKMLAKHYDLVGLYSAGAGNSGILNAIREEGAGDRLTIILHELSDRVRIELQQGVVDAVICQNPGHIARSAVRVLRAYSLGAPLNEAQEKIKIDIHLADNLP